MKTFVSFGLIVAFIAVLTDMATAQSGAPPGGAKALFYGGSGATVQPGAPAARVRPAPELAGNYMGVRYWVELLDRTGQLRRVTTDHRFRAGDRIKLYVQSNREGYLYLVNVGSTNRSTMLFPAAGMPSGSNAIRTNTTYALPPNTFLRFDDNPGEETLLLMFSAVPIDGGTLPGPADSTLTSASGGMAPAPMSPGPIASEPFPQPAPAPPPFVSAPFPQPAEPQPGAFPQPTPGPVATAPFPQPSGPQPGAFPQPAPSFPGSGTSAPYPPPPDVQPGAFSQPGGFPPPQPAMTGDKAARLVQAARVRGAKDLLVETERTGAQPATFVVAPAAALQSDGMVTVQIKLRHY